MGFWTGIKYAINSSLGTEEFKPLDEMVQDVKDTIIGQRTLAASDSVIGVLLSNSLEEQYETQIGVFTPETSGSIRLMWEISNTAGRDDYTRTLKVLENSVEIESYTVSVLRSSTKAFTADLAIKKGKTYVIKRFADTTSQPLNYVKIGANVVDTNLIGIGAI